MESTTRDYRVGLFTFLGLLILGVLILWYGEEPTWFLSTRWQLAVVMDYPTGIGEGTPAFMQGVQVGRVQEIRFQDPQRPSKGAAVIIGIDEEFDIPSGSKADIHPMFGFDKGAIHINPPLYATNPLAREGGFIYGQMKGALDSIVPEEFIAALVTAVEQIGETAGEIEVVSDDLHQLLEVRPRDLVDDPRLNLEPNLYTAIQRVEQSLQLFNEMLAEGGELRQTVARVEQSMAHFQEWTAQLDPRTDRLLGNVESLMGRADQEITRVGERMIVTMDEVSRAANQLNVAVTAVNQRSGTVGLMIHDRRLYEKLVESLDDVQRMIRDLRELALWMSTESKLAW